jgi:hypothetical protein
MTRRDDSWTGEHDTPPVVEWVGAAARAHNAPEPLFTDAELVTWKETGFIIGAVLLSVAIAALVFVGWAL